MIPQLLRSSPEMLKFFPFVSCVSQMQTLTSEKVEKVWKKEKISQPETSRKEENENLKASFSAQKSIIAKRPSMPGDGDVITVDIFNSPYKNNAIASLLKGKTLLNWKKPS